MGENGLQIMISNRTNISPGYQFFFLLVFLCNVHSLFPDISP